jgi:hypothetical protein
MLSPARPCRISATTFCLFLVCFLLVSAVGGHAVPWFVLLVLAFVARGSDCADEFWHSAGGGAGGAGVAGDGGGGGDARLWRRRRRSRGRDKQIPNTSTGGPSGAGGGGADICRRAQRSPVVLIELRCVLIKLRELLHEIGQTNKSFAFCNRFDFIALFFKIFL